jgi:hypothetical protein
LNVLQFFASPPSTHGTIHAEINPGGRAEEAAPISAAVVSFCCPTRSGVITHSLSSSLLVQSAISYN